MKVFQAIWLCFFICIGASTQSRAESNTFDFSNCSIDQIDCVERLTEIEKNELEVAITRIDRLISSGFWELDLSDLQHLVWIPERISETRISKLEINASKLQNLEFFESLSRLTHLEVHNGRANHLDGLKSLENLASVKFYDFDVMDLSAISNSPMLTQIILVGSVNPGLTGFESVPNLVELAITDSPVTESGLGFISSNTRLQFLTLSGTDIREVSFASSLHNLTTFNARDSRLESLDGLRGLRSLGWIWLRNTNVSDISPLEEMFHVGLLEIKETQVTDISAISRQIERGLSVVR